MKRFILKQLAHLRNIWNAGSEWVQEEAKYFFRAPVTGVLQVSFTHRGPEWLRIERMDQRINEGGHVNTVYSVRILYRLKLSVCWISAFKSGEQ